MYAIGRLSAIKLQLIQHVSTARHINSEQSTSMSSDGSCENALAMFRCYNVKKFTQEMYNSKFTE
jgi:hypothetical protein